MTRDLLLRGMLVGVIAGILSFGFLKVVGEPQVDRAIAFEGRMDEARAQARAESEIAKGLTPLKEEHDPELVSRPVQGGIGLFTGVLVYSAAFGGLFSLAFAFVHGRLGRHSPRVTAAVLAAAGFIAVYVIPSLKYAASPPSVGEPETIRIRTILYFGMIVISVAAMTGSFIVRRRLAEPLGGWNASIAAGAVFLGVVVFAGLVLPSVDEVPDAFPAVTLWKFRVASMGAHMIMWATLGLGFGALAERVLSGRRQLRFGAA